MNIKHRLTLQRLIGKIDNDFNLSESDWIPRVAAWTIDALAQMKVLPMEKKKRTLEVSDRLAQFPCELNTTDIKVYDKYGNEIQYAGDSKCQCDNIKNSNREIAIIDVENNTGRNYMQVASVVCNSNKNYVLSCNTFELNFDTDEITVETYEVATYHDDYYNCDVPYIYDNGLLLEALAWYCLFKMLSRGYKHQVYSLASGQPYLNPYQQWMAIKPKATAAVKIELGRGTDRDGWNNFFYNSTFLPRK